MVKGCRYRLAGFSLVEMMVALVFIGLLMAGTATVFKSSVSALSTSGEGIASTRRNRMAVGLLSADLNTADMYLSDLTTPPALSAGSPAFYILPNMPVAGASVQDPQTADQVFFYLDQPLPFEGVLNGTGGGAGYSSLSNSQQVMADVAPPLNNNQFTVDCLTVPYANMVQAGCGVIIKDSFETFIIQGAPVLNGTKVTFSVGQTPNLPETGIGSTGASSRGPHNPNSAVLFYLPAQMIQYQVVMKQFDPRPNAKGIPCLVREQGPYNAGGFVPTLALETIIAENVDGFKAYLSGNSGQGWAGLGANYSGFTNGWTNGLLNDFNTQLGISGRPNYTSTLGDPYWTRDIPTLVRIDITTRTATSRTEYSSTPNSSTAYKDFTQSLVIVPKHFGLTMN